MFMKKWQWLYFFFSIAICIVVINITKAQASPSFPERGKMVVVDAAHKFTPQGLSDLNKSLTYFEKQTHHQLIVATIPDLQGYPIAEYGYQLGRFWKLGRTGADDGVILFWAANTKNGQIRLENGQGMEAALTDAMSKLITDQTAALVVPKGIEFALTNGAHQTMTFITNHESDIKQIQTPNQTAAIWDRIIEGVIGLIALMSIGWISYFIIFRRPKMNRMKNPEFTSWPPTTSPEPVYFNQSAAPGKYDHPYSTTENNYYPYKPASDNSDGIMGAVAAAAAISTVGRMVIVDDAGTDIFGGGNTSSSTSNDDVGFISDNSDDDSFAGGGADSDC